MPPRHLADNRSLPIATLTANMGISGVRSKTTTGDRNESIVRVADDDGLIARPRDGCWRSTNLDDARRAQAAWSQRRMRPSSSVQSAEVRRSRYAAKSRSIVSVRCRRLSSRAIRASCGDDGSSLGFGQAGPRDRQGLGLQGQLVLGTLADDDHSGLAGQLAGLKRTEGFRQADRRVVGELVAAHFAARDSRASGSWRA